MNGPRASRIFTVTVEACEASPDGENHIRVGKLTIADLTGSERARRVGDVTGDVLCGRFPSRMKSTLSSVALGNVISALVDRDEGRSVDRDKGRSTHIPYRDSKLTRLLQDSLGGNARTVMVANCCPTEYNYDETLSTLRYAYRVKRVKNKPRINVDPQDASFREFQEEVNQLKDQQRELLQLQAIQETHRLQKQQKEFEEFEVLQQLRETRTSLSREERIQKLTSKLDELWATVQRGQHNMADIQTKRREQRESLSSTIRDLRKALMLKLAIVDAFVPATAVKQIQARAMWDPCANEYRRACLPSTLSVRLQRSFPENARVNHANRNPNPRFRYSSNGILLTDLDMPQKTSEEYDATLDRQTFLNKHLLGRSIEGILTTALSNVDIDEGSAAEVSKAF